MDTSNLADTYNQVCDNNTSSFFVFSQAVDLPVLPKHPFMTSVLAVFRLDFALKMRPNMLLTPLGLLHYFTVKFNFN